MRMIKYYEPHDLSHGWFLDSVEQFVKNYSVDSSINDINEAIEHYNVFRYIDCGTRLKRWTDEFYNELASIGGILWNKLVRFVAATVNEPGFLRVAHQVDQMYKAEFLSLLTKLKLYEKIPEHQFAEAIRGGALPLVHVLSEEKLVRVYTPGLKALFLEDPQYAEVFLDKVAPSMFSQRDCPVYLPSNISNSEYEDLVVRYIESTNPNPNYLESIATYRNNSRLILSDTTRYLAKKRLRSIEDEYWTSNRGIEHSISVKLITQEDPKVLGHDGLNVEISYDKDWLIAHLDYPTILNNFIYLFEFVDIRMRINLITKNSESSTLLSIISGLSATDYPVNPFFYVKEQMAIYSLSAYIMLLEKQGVNLEQVLEYYYHEHLKEYFAIENFQVSFSVDRDYYERCKSVVSEMEAIVRQYQSYVIDGFIDHEFISVSSSSIVYNSLPSLVPRKYLYSSSAELDDLVYLLFNDQSPLCYIEKLDSRGCIMEHLRTNLIGGNDLNHWQLEPMDRLIAEDIVKKDERGLLTIGDPLKIWIVKELHEFGFLSYHNSPAAVRPMMDEMLECGLLHHSDTLLAKQEASYFNYMLNNQEFGNSRSLRNKYAHGAGPRDEQQNYQDYRLLLMLLLLLTIKINDDLETHNAIQTRRDI